MKNHFASMKQMAGLLSISIFLACFCLPCQAQQSDEIEVERIFQNLKNISQEFMHSREIGIRPDVEIDRQKKELRYGRGRISPILAFNKNDPWKVPLEMQIHVDLLTERFNSLPGGRAIWQPYKERGEGMVKWAIGILLSSPPGELGSVEREFYIFIGETVLPFDQVARKNGLKSNLDEGYGAAEDMLQVEVATDPPGGSVKVIPLLVYRVYQSLGRNLDQWPWKNLLQEKELLLGKYRYMVTWPDGSLTEGQVELKYRASDEDKPEKITFRR